jgi:TetR/AcrR family transcriptional regulator, transcriptional repressor of bet genes
MARKDIKDARRAQLIEATIDSIARYGFARTTLADVARQAKLSQGIVSFYFASKQDLLLATLRHMIAEYEAFSDAAVRRAGPSPAARLDAMVAADFGPAVAGRRQVTVWYAFWGETRWRKDFLRLCAHRAAIYQERTCEMVQQVIDAGGYRDLDAAAIARGLNAMIDGLWLNILLDPKSCDRKEAIRACRAYLAQSFPREFGRQPRVASAA